jgi:hypothetical protein
MKKDIRDALIRINLDQQMERDYRATEAAQAA